MIGKFEVQTHKKNELVDVTSKVRKLVKGSEISDGLVVVYVPHTTAALTINENADPDVQEDMLKGLESVFPSKASYRHIEGNSDAHIKSSVIGVSETILLENKDMVLGTWQGIYFAEFDGPRTRKVYVKILGD